MAPVKTFEQYRSHSLCPIFGKLALDNIAMLYRPRLKMVPDRYKKILKGVWVVFFVFYSVKLCENLNNDTFGTMNIST